MPPKGKTKSYKKRNYKSKSKLGRPSKGLNLSLYKFKRQMPHQVVHLNAAVPGEDWITTYAGQGYIAKLWKFKLDDFPNSGDFTNLFSFYKLTGVALKIYQATSSVPATRNNSQCILTMIPAADGVESIKTPSGLECLQARKDRLLLNTTGKPHNIYMKLTQLSMVYGAATATPPSITDYALITPKWISTDEGTTEHFGIWTYIRAVNGSSFDNIQLRIEPTLYLSCKQVE